MDAQRTLRVMVMVMVDIVNDPYYVESCLQMLSHHRPRRTSNVVCELLGLGDWLDGIVTQWFLGQNSFESDSSTRDESEGH